MEVGTLPKANGTNHDALLRITRGLKAPGLPPTLPAQRLHFLSYTEMAAYPEPRWLIDGLLKQGSSALLFGNLVADPPFSRRSSSC